MCLDYNFHSNKSKNYFSKQLYLGVYILLFQFITLYAGRRQNKNSCREAAKKGAKNAALPRKNKSIFAVRWGVAALLGGLGGAVIAFLWLLGGC